MIYLASKSPRRSQLLGMLGVSFELVDVNIQEQWDGIEPAEDYVRRLALEKARAAKHYEYTSHPVLAADTEVVIDNEILGKPADKSAAMAMLQKLSGRCHRVLSAVALVHDTEKVVLNSSLVSFKPLSLSECEAYCETGEPYDKAGAYAIQGRAAAFVTRLEGSYSGVMGLPLAETTTLLSSVSDGATPDTAHG